MKIESWKLRVDTLKNLESVSNAHELIAEEETFEGGTDLAMPFEQVTTELFKIDVSLSHTIISKLFSETWEVFLRAQCLFLENRSAAVPGAKLFQNLIQEDTEVLGLFLSPHKKKTSKSPCAKYTV